MKRRLTTLLAATTLATGMVSGTALAQGPAPVPGPPSHEHSLTTPGNGSVVQIGPPVCRVPQADRGARNFHIRVHSVMAGAAPTTTAGLEIGFWPTPDVPRIDPDGEPPFFADDSGRWCFEAS
jgi:hypothetical protein